MSSVHGIKRRTYLSYAHEWRECYLHFSQVPVCSRLDALSRDGQSPSTCSIRPLCNGCQCSLTRHWGILRSATWELQINLCCPRHSVWAWKCAESQESWANPTSPHLYLCHRRVWNQCLWSFHYLQSTSVALCNKSTLSFSHTLSTLKKKKFML